MFEEKDKIAFTPKDIKQKEVIEEVNGEKKERNIFKGPFQEKMKVLRGGKYRLNKIPYDCEPGDFIDGALLSPKKKEILIATKYIVAV